MTVIAKAHSAAGKWVNVTPAMAEKWLNENNTENRPLKDGRVEMYARDMKSGNWTPNPEPILFYEDGVLCNGQHRLFAVIEANTVIPFYIITGVSRKAALNIDTGKARSLSDNAKIAGWGGPISHSAQATAVIMHFGKRPTGKTLSNSERLELINKYEKQISYAELHVPKKPRVSIAPVRAAVARANLYLGDHKRLAEFCEILGTGMQNNATTDKAAIALRIYLLEITVGRDLDARDIFLKAMNAIEYFVKGKPLTAIKALKDEAYPLKGKRAIS